MTHSTVGKRNSHIMNESVLNELRLFANLLAQCLVSFKEDFKSIDCKKPDVASALVPSLISKLDLLAQCAKSIQRLVQSLKKEDLPCLPCIRKNVSSKSEAVGDGC